MKVVTQYPLRKICSTFTSGLVRNGKKKIFFLLLNRAWSLNLVFGFHFLFCCGGDSLAFTFSGLFLLLQPVEQAHEYLNSKLGRTC